MLLAVPGVEFFLHDRARFYVLGMGFQDGVHGVRLYGHNLQRRGHHIAVVELAPGSATGVDVEGQMIGTWMLTDSVHAHTVDGQAAKFHIAGKVFRSSV